MELAAKRSRKELTVTLVIWFVLVILAGSALLLLRNNAIRIINRIHYVNVSRGDKASVLYAEAEKNARIILKDAVELNDESKRKVAVKSTDPRLQKVIRLFEEALKTDARPEFAPERVVYYELLGQVFDAAGNRPGQLLSQAKAFISQGDNGDASDYIKEARQVAPASPEPLLLMAELQAHNNDTSGALVTLEDLFTSFTAPAKAHWLRGQLVRNSDEPMNAIEDLKAAVEGDPHNLTFRRDLGTFLFDVGKTSDAVKVLQDGLSDGGWQDAAYLHTYGIYLTEIGDLNEAIRVLIQADKLAPYSGDIQWSLAKAYHDAGKLRQEASAMRRAIEAKPELRNQIF